MNEASKKDTVPMTWVGHDEIEPLPPKPMATPRQLIERMAEAASARQNELRDRLNRPAA